MDSPVPPDDQSVLAADDPDGRLTRRESLFLGVDIKRAIETPPGRIRNISATGALVEADARFEIGEHIILSFRSVTDMGATVVRKTSKGVGVRFDAKIDPTACRQKVAPPDAKPAWSPPVPTSRHPALQLRPRR